MHIRSIGIAGALVVEGQPHTDHRGAFSRLFCERELAEVVGDRHVVQINHSRTHAVGAVRGMHFQHPPHAEMKMVRCVRGRVWDVLVDLRAGSPTFLHWHAEELSPDASRMLVIPEGCAHGFQVLEADSELLYLHTAFYTPPSEGALRYDDPLLAIPWPLPVTDLSERDKTHALLSNNFIGLDV
ncbi:MAG: dTDP-4-dehydrorhamnose 3,5-epimerase family protein [Azonexus sp.]|nr:dTDP-4-dehydrorhamnose 3,5-epimerase family protein [Azonexus sp.]